MPTPQYTNRSRRPRRQSPRAIALLSAALLLFAMPGLPALAQSNPGVGVPAKLPRPISGIVPSKTPPLQRVPPQRPNTGAPVLRPGERPDHRPVVVYPPGYGWRYDRPGIRYNPDFYDTSESSITASVGTDHWRVKFRVGSPVIHRAKDWYWWRYPYWGYSHWCWWNDYPRYAIGGYWDYTDQFLDYASQVQYDQTADQRKREEQAERERFAKLGDLEKADELLGSGKPADAATHYLKHLDSAPNDTEAMRSLAVALIDSNKVDQACAILSLAYERTPALVQQPMDASRFPGSSTELRGRLNSVIHYANRTGAASAWLSGAVLAQAEGRPPAARNMISKAKSAGLKTELVTAFETTLGTR